MPPYSGRLPFSASEGPEAAHGHSAVTFRNRAENFHIVEASFQEYPGLKPVRNQTERIATRVF